MTKTKTFMIYPFNPYKINTIQLKIQTRNQIHPYFIDYGVDSVDSAKKSFETLKKNFLQQGNKESSISALDACLNYIDKQLMISKKQTMINIFFKYNLKK